ncbi:hypothetical protein [Wenxinia saemankumensis]|uniref:Uncharacterized protein n=1 Tax=Wenxinia saemankumensis TaxID=1447782 RepID=A0A1M6AUV0_9RHOB|nr:hypothetical protein [Wenxinia saemankumensis]SHI40207.1 hypothetical protein SAMN05444417_0634 [Wenxinia saemankumensis]
MTTDPAPFRRKVFYIPGYDPIHPRRYRELYRKEGAAQAALSGYGIALAPKAPGSGAYGWHVTGRMEGRSCETDVEVLVWSDIVRGSMPGSIPATYAQLVRTAWTYISTGALRRLMWLRKGPVIAALYPVGALLLQLALACAAGAAAWWALTAAVAAAFALAGLAGPAGGPVPALAGLAAGAALAALVLRWFKRRDGRFYAYYLMHDYAFSARWRGANPPALEARMDAFGAQVAAALGEAYDEVLVVGHSSGAHLGISVLADLIRAGRVPANGPALSFLSLGQVVPMMSFLPDAHRLRADLAFLSMRAELAWIDVTAPGDGCAFALCDPVAVSGVQPAGARWPRVYSAAFTQTLRPETWKALRWRFFRLHFQYLCAFDALPGSPSDYDYFRVTAGPRTLAERFEGRPQSVSRIDVPASKYTSVAA